MNESIAVLVLGLDLCGTFAFALGGAMAAVRQRLDFYGVLVVAFVTSSVGGILRDLLIGAIPPAALLDWRYLAVSVAAGLIVFFWHSFIERFRSPTQVLDSVGLAFFCVAGAHKALEFGLSPLMASLLGMITAVGGGIVRDVLLGEVPAILRSELYAAAALTGAAVVVTIEHFQTSSFVAAIAGGIVCFGLRTIAIRRGWHLPTARGPKS